MCMSEKIKPTFVLWSRELTAPEVPVPFAMGWSHQNSINRLGRQRDTLHPQWDRIGKQNQVPSNIITTTPGTQMHD